MVNFKCPYNLKNPGIQCLCLKCKFAKILYMIDESTPEVICLLNIDPDEYERLKREVIDLNTLSE